MWDPYAEAKSETLSNGLSVHVIHWPKRSSVAIGVGIHSGARHDPTGFEGAAHFVEHQVFNNAPLSMHEIESFIKGCGGDPQTLGETGYLSTEYRFFVPADGVIVAKLLDTYGRMLLQPTTLKKNIEREREIIIGEFRREYPMKFQSDALRRRQRALYDGHWFGRFISELGSLSSIRRITSDELQLFHDAHYTPANMSVVCVGGLPLSQIVRLLSESPFGMEKPGVRMPLPVPLPTFPLPAESRYEVTMSAEYLKEQDGTETVRYETAAVIPGCFGRLLVEVVKEMLLESLEAEIRGKRGWTYAILPTCEALGDVYDFSVTCEALELGALSLIRDVVDECVAELSSREDLFEKIRNENIAERKMQDLTGRDVCENILIDLSKNHRIVPLAEEIMTLSALSFADVREVLGWLSPERRWTYVARP